MPLSRAALLMNRPPLLYRLPVTNRFVAPNSDALSSGLGSSTWAQSMTEHTAFQDMNHFQADVWGWKVAAGLADTGIPRTVTGMLEYPLGMFRNFTWAGATTKSVASGSTTNKSDVLSLSAPVPRGAKFRLHWQETFSAFIGVQCAHRFGGDAYGFGTGTPPALGTTYATTTGNLGMVSPNALTALMPEKRKIIAFMGASNTVDPGYATDAYGATSFGRGLSDYRGVCFFKCADVGSTIGVNYNHLSFRLASWVAQGVTDLMVHWGTNDLSNTDVSATMISNTDAMVASIAAAGIVPHISTLPPKYNTAPNSGGHPAFEATRIPYNAYVRSSSNTGNYGKYWEPAASVETAFESGFWITNGSSDGVHINWGNSTIATPVLNRVRNDFYGF